MRSNYLKVVNQNLGMEGVDKATGVPRFSVLQIMMYIILFVTFNGSNNLSCNKIIFSRRFKEDDQND